MDKLNVQSLECMIWGEELKSKFRSIICSQGHSYWRECSPSYIEQLFRDPELNIPAKWDLWKEEIDFDQIDRVLKDDQFKKYNNYVILKSMGPDDERVNCPHCDYFEIWGKEDKLNLFYCKNSNCRKGTWLVCKGTFKYPRDVCNMTPEEEKEMVSKDGVNSHIYWIDYIDQVQEIIQIIENNNERKCPSCGYKGRK